MKSVEIFAGAGGLALGLERAGFEPMALFENDHLSCSTLAHNRPQWDILEEDVRNVDFRKFKNVDLLSGGPPCQPFSVGGISRGSGDRRDMFPQALRAVSEMLPRAFVFENVGGLLRPSFRSYIEYIKLSLALPLFHLEPKVPQEKQLVYLQKAVAAHPFSASETYKVGIYLIQAADYGVPQHRRRVFIVGFRGDVLTDSLFPSPTHSRNSLLESKWGDGSYWKDHSIPPPRTRPSAHFFSPSRPTAPRPPGSTLARWRTVRDALSDLPHPKSRHSYLNHEYHAGAKIYPGHTGSQWDEPSKTIKSGVHGVPGGENMIAHGNGRVRYFSVREAARIQTFPDEYFFNAQWSEAMRQVGNAVPVALAEQIGNFVFRTLERKSLAI